MSINEATKVLINQDFEAIRIGDFVEASESDGEFLLTPKSDVSLNCLYEISRANKLGIKKAKSSEKSKMLQAILAAILALHLPEQNKMSESQLIDKIVINGVNAGLNDHEIMLQLIQEAEVPIKDVPKIYEKVMTDNGFRITSKQRKEIAYQYLNEQQFRPTEYHEIETMVKTLMEMIKDTAEVHAFQLIRSWSKTVNVELPKQPRRSAGSLQDRVLVWILENKPATKEVLHDGILQLSNGKKNDEKFTNLMWRLVEFAESYLKRHTAIKEEGAVDNTAAA